MKTLILILMVCVTTCHAEDTLKIGSKRFTESYILGEILNQKALQTGEAKVQYQPGLGNTGIIFAALQEGAIDVYPDYTGTIIHEFLKVSDKTMDLEKLRNKLKPLGINADIVLGFTNSYALAIRREMSEQLGIKKISDLLKHPELRMGFSQEFLKRKDGWDELKKAYGLPQENVFGIDHSLSYEAIDSDQIDITDAYTTDAKINTHHLVILEDDRHFFPSYVAILLYRPDVPHRFPKTWNAFKRLQGQISENVIMKMNAQAELEGLPFTTIAQQFLNLQETGSRRDSFLDLLFGPDLWTLTKQHLFLVFGSLIPAIVIGVLLGIIAAHFSGTRHLILSFVGIVQTIPALALLAFLIPMLQQIGTVPALIALFLYALLPIVRNTYAGLTGIPNPLKESAVVLDLSPFHRLGVIELPLAANSILSGIKTAAVINVGMATIAAFIGAGGYGERIVTGLALNDYQILLAGAIPACVMAILVQLGFDLLDYIAIPKGLRETG